MPARIHITGASGAGTTTLGRHLAAALGSAHFDSDDYYWLPTNPPYREKRESAERVGLLRAALADRDSWVLSGSLVGWGDPLIPEFTIVVFLETPAEIRLQRLREREALRFGAEALQRGGALHEQHLAFLEWAAAYDSGGMDVRSRARHSAWLAQIVCPVIMANGDAPPEAIAGGILARL